MPCTQSTSKKVSLRKHTVLSVSKRKAVYVKLFLNCFIFLMTPTCSDCIPCITSWGIMGVICNKILICIFIELESWELPELHPVNLWLQAWKIIPLFSCICLLFAFFSPRNLVEAQLMANKLYAIMCDMSLLEHLVYHISLGWK